MATFFMMLGFFISVTSPIIFGIGLYKPSSVLPKVKSPTKLKSSLLSLGLLLVGLTLWASFAGPASIEIQQQQNELENLERNL